MREINAILTIAYRDFIKLTRDRARIAITFIFPFMFIGVLGGSLQANLGREVGYNFMIFVFLGVLAQTLFQSTSAGIISLIEDRENDFSQEIFVSPISRYSIIIGKIIGETLVSLTQGLGILFFAVVMQIPISYTRLFAIFPVAIIACLFGGAFGIIVLSNLSNQRAANQIFPFIIFPQIFLSGVFNPIKTLPPVLFTLSRIAPMTYAVDLMRSVYYWGMPEYDKVVLYSPVTNLTIISIMFILFTAIGTALFVRNERNR